MSHLSASFSATIRVGLADDPGSFARVAQAIGDAGGSLGAIDLVRADGGTKVRDVTVEASDADHLERIVAAVRAVDGVEVEHVSDRTFLLHLGGKLEMRSKTPIRTRDDLSMAYTPGVARICMAIAQDRDAAWNLTVKRNSVAVVSDGTAVLGLGDIGPEAAMPVMEGKAALFKEFGGVDAWPICLSTKDVDQIVAAVAALAPGFGGINLEDISSPRCFEIERRLQEELDIPVFHDDQHGTAIVVLAALLNALTVVGKRLEDVRIVLTGVGAAGIAVTDILLAAGARTIVGCDSVGAIHRGARRPQPRQGRVRGAHEPGRRGGRRGRRSCAAPTSTSGSRSPARSARPGSGRWRTTRSSSRWPTRRPRSRPATSRPAASRSSRRGARTTRTRSTTCSRSRASSAARSTSAPRGSPRG